MKNIINTKQDLVKESIQGFCLANPTLVNCHHSPLFVTRKQPNKHKVAIISGGGSGHEPLHLGSIGIGMLDAVCPGELLTSPTPDQILAAIESVGTEMGVLLIVKNYQGDKMNFNIAQHSTNCTIETVYVNDDVATSDKDNARGIAGTAIVEKVVGAAAERGLALNELTKLAQTVNSTTKSIGIGLNPLSLPLTNAPMYPLPEGEMEYGVGIHGEKGSQRIAWLPANELAKQMINDIIKHLPTKTANSNNEVLLFINGLGATPLLELYLMYKEAHDYVESLGYKVIRSLVGNYVTSLNMAGCSITLSVLDETRLAYWDQPVKTSHFNW